MVLRIDAHSSRELQAILLAVRRAPKEIQAQIRKQSKAIAQPEWQKSMAEHARTRLEHMVLVRTARVSVSNQNIRLSSASIGKSLAGGLKPSQSYAAVEFGADRSSTRTYEATSRKGRRYTVHQRRTTAQLRPRNVNGFVFYPAVAQMIPRIASLWAQTTVRTFAEALEGKSNG